MINIVVALPFEARPLVAHYDLKGRHDIEPYPVYEGVRMRLIVSGVGKTSSAAAVAYLHALSGAHRSEAWLNIGVGGHADWPVGKGILAHKITDHASGKNWYPPMVFQTPCTTAEVLTVDRVAHEYPSSAVHDMEASGFYDTACRFSTSELVQCFKIVSDNPTAPSHEVTPETVQKLMADHLETIDRIMAALAQLQANLAAIESDPPDYQRCLEQRHFTVSEQHQLRRLLQRWHALNPDQSIPELASESRAREVLLTLQERVDSPPIKL